MFNKFNSNEECAAALYRYLISHNHISARDPFVQENNILHDINNLRGYEWLDIIERNKETRAFFEHIGYVEYSDAAFVCGAAVEPRVLLKVAIDQDCSRDATYDEVRDVLDKNGCGELWDYAHGDADEAIANNEHLMAVAFYSPEGYEARLFEITEEMADRFWDLVDTKEIDERTGLLTRAGLERQIAEAETGVGEKCAPVHLERAEL